MSHTVTITRTTTTTTTSALIINTGYLKTWPGILKLAQLILGAITVGIVSYYVDKYGKIQVPELFYLLIAVAFLIGTFLILTSCMISISTASILPKTIYEVVFHGFAFFIYIVASLVFLVEVNQKKNQSYYYDYEPYLAAAVIGMVISALYLLSTIFALRTYKGL